MKYLSAKKSCVLLFLEHSEADDGHDEQQDEAEDRSHNIFTMLMGSIRFETQLMMGKVIFVLTYYSNHKQKNHFCANFS